MTARRLAAVLLVVAAAARADDFYGERMQRGLTNYQRGNFAKAASELRIAAFGFVDSPADYETAMIYALLANHKLGNDADAAPLADRLANAERLAPTYAKLPLPAAVRAELDATLPKLLRPDQLARVPAFGRAPVSAPATTPMSLLQSGDEAAARAMAEKILADDYTNALAQTVLAILAGRRGDWGGVVDHYSVVRTRRRLTPEEMNTFIMGLVRTGHTNDAAGVERTRGLQPFVARATSMASTTPAPPPTAPTTPAALLADADRALREGRVVAARDAYRRLAATPNVPRELALDAARGLNQSAAFRDSSAVYQKLYPLHSGEELHMFYEAVNRYEMGDYAIAKKLMARALPSLPRTRDVELYRSRIERTQ